jgi:hypothetical protein
MAAFRFFRILQSPRAVRSAYDDATPQTTHAGLTALWSPGAQGRPACRWKA